MTEINVTFVTDLVRAAGTSLKDAFASVEPLADREQLFAAFKRLDDSTAERLRSALAREYPGITWSDGEFDSESQRSHPPGEFWVCDAIDGAVQFLQAIPAWALSLALIRDGRPVFSAVYDPVHGELFHAVAGGGAYLNGKPLHVSAKQRLEDALVAASQPPFVGEDPESIRRAGEATAAVLPLIFVLRNFGPTSLQLAYVAAGRIDAFWEFGEDMYNWLAGILLIREAGGVVTDAHGGALEWGATSFLAAAPALHAPMTAVLQTVK
ncbi:inositol monophosphatase family protein [Vitiosangium sp. GDMCC 1.1324]|uniref:inositol monophosphatase family protein n=1 Tax=Vitiosangium sp. (strain GDMCC 1.1324) TaxID=2138576 RepID=UPI000D3725C0|nr:inositol monophosphatase family protein [Vitiosangium sp. GDMCC 1.1324]PTL77223.1 inositol-phosphate phosphatase [Vitiosangium sp. GDMCC 1.1324]